MSSIRCPKCGSTNVSTTAGYKWKKVGGYAADMATAFASGYFLGDLGNPIAENIDIAGSVSKEWECQRCHYVWSENQMNDNQKKAPAVFVPDSFVQQEKEALERRLKPTPPSVNVGGIILSCILVCITFTCLWYCCVNEPWSIVMKDNWLIGMHEEYEYHFLWWFMGFLFVAFLISSIVTISVNASKHSKAKKEYDFANAKYNLVKNMSLNQFRMSSYYKDVEYCYRTYVAKNKS